MSKEMIRENRRILCKICVLEKGWVRLASVNLSKEKTFSNEGGTESPYLGEEEDNSGQRRRSKARNRNSSSPSKLVA